MIEPVITAGNLKVFIDPGHGGSDSGAVFEGIQEKNLNLQVAQKLANALSQKGFQTKLSRENDSYISIDDRVRMANAFFEGTAPSNTFFISIHFNSNQANYCPITSQSIAFYKLSNQTSQDFSTTITNAMASSQIASNYATRSENQSQSSSFGVLYVNTDNKTLIEVEFLCNPSLKTQIQGPEWQEKAANAISEGILAFAQQKTTPASSSGFKTAYATVFDGSKNTAGNCNNSCVALPDSTALNRTVEVCNLDGSKCRKTTVGDTGPWCTQNNAYVFGNERPFAEINKNKNLNAIANNPSCPLRGLSNGAGIDLTQNIASALGITGDPDTDRVKWKFA